MIRVLSAEDVTNSNCDCEKFVGKEFDSFEDFVKSVSRTYIICEIDVTSDITVGTVYLENKLVYTEKAILWFEDVNIINPRKYQKYL
jgi:hypothetical protein